MSDLILCSDAVRVGVAMGLTVQEACETLRTGLDTLQLPLWGRRRDTLFATRDWLNNPEPVENYAQQLEPVLISDYEVPTADGEGVGVLNDEEKEETLTVIMWLDDLLRFKTFGGGGPVTANVRDLHYHRQKALSMLRLTVEQLGRSKLVVTRRGGRPSMIDYNACSVAILSEIERSPHFFRGPDGRIRQNSDKDHQHSIIRAARDWCDRNSPSHEPPSDDTLRRKVANPLAPKLAALGYLTWKDRDGGETLSPVVPRHSKKSDPTKAPSTKRRTSDDDRKIAQYD